MQAIDVADTLITISNQVNEPINHLKLEKIVYFLDVLHRYLYDTALVDDEFQNWLYGPVNPQIYNEYSFQGNDLIQKTTTHLIDKNENGLIFQKFNLKKISINDYQFIKDHWQIFNQFESIDLITVSQAEPQWQKHHQMNERHNVINQKKAVKYYTKNKFW